jgi:hypothetical protein
MSTILVIKAHLCRCLSAASTLRLPLTLGAGGASNQSAFRRSRSRAWLFIWHYPDAGALAPIDDLRAVVRRDMITAGV